MSYLDLNHEVRFSRDEAHICAWTGSDHKDNNMSYMPSW